MELIGQLADRFKAEFTARIISVVATGLLIVILARLFSPSDYGLLFLTLSVLSVAQLFSTLGWAKSAGRYLAEYKEKNSTQIPHILRISFQYTLLTTSSVVLILILFHQDIAVLVDELELAQYLLLGSLYVIAYTFVSYLRTIFQGLERIEFSALIQVLDRVSQLILVSVFVLLGFGIFGAIGGYILASTFAVLVGMSIVYFRFYRPHPKSAVESGLSRRIFEYNVPLIATSTASVLDKRVDVILVGFFLGPMAVSFYVIGRQVTEFIETPVKALGFTIAPSYSSLKTAGNLNRSRRIYETALVHSLLLYLPAAAGMIILAEPIVELVFGTDYLGAVVVIQILTLYMVLFSITKITSQGLDYLGRAKARAVAKAVMAVSNVGLNIVLIPLVGVAGAAIATVVTFGGYTAANVYIMYSELSFRPKKIVPDVVIALCITAVMSVFVIVAIRPITGLLSIVVGSIVGVAVWAALSVAVGVLDLDQLKSAFL